MDKDTPPNPDNGSPAQASDSTSSPQAPSTGSGQAGFSAIWAELKRRHVVRVALVYAVVGWIVMQVASLTFEGFGIPIWAFRFVMLMVILGFPISLVIAWAFELTPQGIKTTKSAQEEIRLLENTARHAEETEGSKAHAKKRSWFSLAFAAAVPTLIFGILALYFYATRSGTSSAHVTPEQSGGGPHQVEDLDKSIAVLPLANMSPDPNNAFFADGVHEDILTNLSKIRDLLVIGRTSTLQYRDTVKTLKEIGTELDVRYLLEGSVRREGNQVRVTVQLIDSQKRGHIWAENYNRSLDDIFAIQSEVAQTIAEKLQAVLLPEEKAKIERRPTENQEAWDYFLQSRQSRASRTQLLEKAVALDPQFAEAWAALAGSRIRSWSNRRSNDPELLASAHYALSQAELTGPGLPDIPWARNLFALREQYDIQASIEHLLEALAIDPEFIDVRYNLGVRYVGLGRLVEAQHHFEALLRYDPLNAPTIHNLAYTYALAGKWDKVPVLMEKYPESMPLVRNAIAQTNYLKTGDKHAFAATFDNDERGAKKAMLERKHRSALEHLEAEQSSNSSNLIRGIGNSITFFIEPLELLTALLWHELGEKEKWLAEANKAATQLEELLKNFQNGLPRGKSTLAICYALQSERELMESTIANVREQTSLEKWRHRQQVQCEIHIAICYLILGENDKAIETLEAASKMDSPIFLNRELDLWFIFDRLRGNPRFDKLLEN